MTESRPVENGYAAYDYQSLSLMADGAVVVTLDEDESRAVCRWLYDTRGIKLQPAKPQGFWATVKQASQLGRAK